MTSAEIWDAEIPVPVETIQRIDPGLAKTLSDSLTIHAISPYGSSYWARTALVEAHNPDGISIKFFMKVMESKDQANFEYSDLIYCYRKFPNLFVRPFCWGSYENGESHFVLSEFYAFQPRVYPQPRCAAYNFGAMIADMHKQSARPGGKFGFPQPVYAGRVRIVMLLSHNWEEVFSHLMRSIWEEEMRVHGTDRELQILEEAMTKLVIPRLLRSIGDITPVLCHGNLWEGNTGIDPVTGNPKLFDPMPCYAHHEYELGPMRPRRHREWGQPMIEEYEKHMEYTEPKDEAEDRGLLYSLRFDSVSSCLYHGKADFWRPLMKKTMRQLFIKYGEGINAMNERLDIVDDLKSETRKLRKAFAGMDTARNGTEYEKFVVLATEVIKKMDDLSANISDINDRPHPSSPQSEASTTSLPAEHMDLAATPSLPPPRIPHGRDYPETREDVVRSYDIRDMIAGESSIVELVDNIMDGNIDVDGTTTPHEVVDTDEDEEIEDIGLADLTLGESSEDDEESWHH